MKYWEKMSKGKNAVIAAMIYVCFTILMILVISNKKNLYIDETYSYGLANNHGSIEIEVEDGVRYEPAELPFMNYMCVEEGESFDYVNVWENQAADVHPPLYYALLHTICSLFAGEFSIWFAGAINIVFSLFTLYIVRKIVFLMSNDIKLMNIISLAFVCIAGILHTVSFLRMYSMAMFFMTWVTYFFLILVEKEDVGLKDWIVLIIGAILGAITHYYCIIYLFFICLIYGGYLLFCKRWKTIRSFVGSMCVAGGGALLLFPAMLQHIFTGYRGRQSFGNFKNVSVTEYIKDLKKYFFYVNEHLFGEWGGLLLLIIVLIGIMSIINKKKNEYNKLRMIRFAILGIPSIMYLFLIAKIAVYKTDRYIFPVYAVIYTLVWMLFYETIKNIKKYKYHLLIISFVFVVVGSAKNTGFVYLYKETETLIENAKSYSDIDCLYIYDEFWQIQPSFYEVAEYKSVTFLNRKNIQQLGEMDCRNNSELILVVTEECEDTIKNVLEMSTNLTQYIEMGEFGSAKSYYLY